MLSPLERAAVTRRSGEPMSKDDDHGSAHLRWARLRFSIVGPLLAAPPARGELRAELERLAAKEWRHPTKGTPKRFGLSTIERWYYAALRDRDPLAALRRRPRKDSGVQRVMNAALQRALRAQHGAHRRWSYQLHYDNLVVLVEQDTALAPMPSYTTVLRFMKAVGLLRVRGPRRPRDTAGAERAASRLESLEVRSYEAEYVNGLWHADFHVGSRSVLLPSGEWVRPHLFCALDDHSRLICHVQWYLGETTEAYVHGLSQGFQKRDLPGSIMTDRGGAEMAGEAVQGLERLPVLHLPTLPYSPYQNAKQEVLWAQVEGRLLPMLEGVKDLTLDVLNEATQAWAELDYNRRVHDELGTTPLDRFVNGKRVGRACPSSEALRRAFRLESTRRQRRSDGTVSIEGKRFEVPSRYRHLERVTVRYARWDLTAVDLVDARADTVLCVLHPLDKAKNADGARRALEPGPIDDAEPPPEGMAPLLKKLLADYAATGLPPAYLPKTTKDDAR